MHLMGQEAYNRHTVLAGETVYSIAKQYSISPETLVKYNPDIATGLREGAILIIPIQAAPAVNAKVLTHTVKPQETIYGLCKTYGCSEADLIALNPELVDGLKVDMVIKIPSANAPQNNITEDSSAYTYQIVEPKETVYSICRAAGISEETFLALNPTVKENGLQIGQTIKLPKNDITQTPKKASPPPVASSNKKMFDLYRVESGSTLSSIARRFNCTQEELLSLNPEVVDGLKVGKYIVVPIKQKSKQKHRARVKSSDLFWATNDTSGFAKVHIAVLLPLYLEINDSLSAENNQTENIYEKSKIALQFLSGIRIAMDTLSKHGINIQLDVFDTENNSERIDQIAKEIHPNTSLVIGPLYAKNAERLARLLPEKTIVSPLSKAINNAGLPNLVDGVNNLDAEYRAMARWINAQKNSRAIVFLNTDTVLNHKPVALIKENINTKDSTQIKYIWVDKSFGQLNKLDDYINPDTTTTLVVVDQNSAFLSDLLRKLNKRRDSSLSLLSTSKIFDIPALENKYLNALNFIATHVDYLNVEDTTTQLFIASYRALTGTEPTRFAYYGYDTGLYFAQLIALNGGLPDLDKWPSVQGLHKGFYFMRENENGPVNTFTFYLGVKNYTIQERTQ